MMMPVKGIIVSVFNYYSFNVYRSDVGVLYLPAFVCYLLGIGVVMKVLAIYPNSQWLLMHVSMIGMIVTCLLFAVVRCYELVDGLLK